MSGKPQVRVLQESPLLVGIAKNGRGVHEKSALAALRKAYPDVPAETWLILQSDHGTFARIRDSEPLDRLR